MSKSQVQQQSAFKQLYTELFNNGGDFGKVSNNLKKPLKCYVKESYPHFLITDGYFFVTPYFTKEAVSEFHSKFPNVNIVDLTDKVIVINNWSIELKKVNSAEVFTSYANLEARLIVHSFKPNLQERLNPTRYPVNLYRDDEFKTTIQHFRHQALQQSLAKTLKSDNLPDISKVSGADKKAKVDAGIVKAGTGKGDDFSDFSFKEGNTATLKIQDILMQEKGKDALNRMNQGGDAGAAQVKGGAKGKAKAAAKSAAKGKKASAKKGEVSATADVRKSVDKIVKYTPNKPGSRKETPQKSQSAPAAGKVSAKRTTTGAKKTLPTAPSPSGKKSTKTTDQMTMAQFKKYLAWHEQKKAGKSSSGGKVLGKRSAGKASATSGKASKASKRSKK